MSFYCEVKLMWQLIEAMAVQMERFCSVELWKKGVKDAPTLSVLHPEFTRDRPWWFTWECPCVGISSMGGAAIGL